MRKLKSSSAEKATVCPLDCADTCSLSVEVSHGRAVKVRGNNNNPFTRNKICSKVATGLTQQVHGVDRLTQPLKRTGDKGSNATFEPVTWPEALDIIYEQWSKYIAEHGPQSIVPMTYGGSVGLLASATMNQRFFNTLGARRVNNATLCAGVYGAAYRSVLGSAGGMAHAELGDSKLNFLEN